MCLGVGTIFLHYNAIILVNYHYKYSEQLSVAMGFALCGQPVAIMTTPFILYWLQKHLGWTGASVVCGSSSFTLVLIALLLQPEEDMPSSAPPDVSSLSRSPREKSRLQPQQHQPDSACQNFIHKLTATTKPEQPQDTATECDPEQLKTALETLAPKITSTGATDELMIRNTFFTSNLLHVRSSGVSKSSAEATIFEEDEEDQEELGCAFDEESQKDDKTSMQSSFSSRESIFNSATAAATSENAGMKPSRSSSSIKSLKRLLTRTSPLKLSYESVFRNHHKDSRSKSVGSESQVAETLFTKPELVVTFSGNVQNSNEYESSLQIPNGNLLDEHRSSSNYLSVSNEALGGDLNSSLTRSRSFEDSPNTKIRRESLLSVPVQSVKRVRSADDVHSRINSFKKSENNSSTNHLRQKHPNHANRRGTLAFVIRSSVLTSERRETLANIAIKPFHSNRRDSVRAFSGVTVPEILVAATFRGMWIKAGSVSEIQAQKLDWLRKKNLEKERKKALKNPRIWIYGIITLLLRASFAMILVYIPTKQLILTEHANNLGVFSTMFCLG